VRRVPDDPARTKSTIASLLARDNNLPHIFALRADRQVYRYGVAVLAGAALILLIAAEGDTQALVPFFAIAVFIGFTVSQVGMVRHWRAQRGAGWRGRAVVNGIGAVLTGVAAVIEFVAKFAEGGWVVFVAIALLALGFRAINRAYRRIGVGLRLGELPGPPQERRALVIVPVGAVNQLTREALGAALSLGDEVRAVTVVYADDVAGKTADIEAVWKRWHPDVPLTVVVSHTRSLTRPIVDYVRAVHAEDEHDRLVVLIHEMQLPRPWQRLLQNQREAVLDRAIRRYTNAVICRLRFRIDLAR